MNSRLIGSIIMLNLLTKFQDNPLHCIVSSVYWWYRLGCLAYTGGPLVKCSCVGDDQTIMLPYVSYSPDSDDNTPLSLCMCK